MTLDPRDAALRVLTEDPQHPLHWTVVWDRALRAGYLDPRIQTDAREALIRALAEEARAGRIEKTSTGTYRHRPEP